MVVGFIRKYLSADGLLKIVKHRFHLEKDKAVESFIRRNLLSLYGFEKAPSDPCMREGLDVITPQQYNIHLKKCTANVVVKSIIELVESSITIKCLEWYWFIQNTERPEPIVKGDVATKNDCGAPRGAYVTRG